MVDTTQETLLEGSNMTASYFYALLEKKSGEKCFTLSIDNPAEMTVDQDGISIIYPSGKRILIHKDMVEHAIRVLTTQGELTVEEMRKEITHGNKPRTTKLMAVLRKLPGVTIQKIPRKLIYK